MKTTLTVIILSLSSFLSAAGQPNSRPNFYVKTGVSFPSSPMIFSDEWNTGFNLGGGIGFPVSQQLTVIFNLTFNSFGLDDERFLQDRGIFDSRVHVDGGTKTISTLFVDFKGSFSATRNRTTPYVVGGLGIFRLSQSAASVDFPGHFVLREGHSETRIGIGLGAGVDFPIGPRSTFFVEGRFVSGNTEGQNTAFFPIHIGFAFK